MKLKLYIKYIAMLQKSSSDANPSWYTVLILFVAYLWGLAFSIFGCKDCLVFLSRGGILQFTPLEVSAPRWYTVVS